MCINSASIGNIVMREYIAVYSFNFKKKLEAKIKKNKKEKSMNNDIDFILKWSDLNEKFAFNKRIIKRAGLDTADISFECNPINDEWKASINDKWWSVNYTGECDNKIDRRLFELRNILLDFGGEEVCLPGIDEDIENILTRGILFPTNKTGRIKLMKGEPCRCHANSCNLWRQNKDNKEADIHICTGYALSLDGVWRQHSWLVYIDTNVNRPKIIETTAKRIAYFGFIMTDEEADSFYWDNW